MKVTSLEILRCDAGWRNYRFLKLTTDSGIVGWSEFDEGFGSPRVALSSNAWRRGSPGTMSSITSGSIRSFIALPGRQPAADLNRGRRYRAPWQRTAGRQTA
jgi:hypothetical protein